MQAADGYWLIHRPRKLSLLRRDSLAAEPTPVTCGAGGAALAAYDCFCW